MKLKLYRDKVISIVKGKDLVGVYVKHWHIDPRDNEHYGAVVLAEMPPKKADKIIKLWNSK